MQQVINLKIIKDNKIYFTQIHKNNKCKLLNKNKIIKAKNLKPGDILLNNFTIMNISLISPFFKIKKTKELLLTNNLQNFYEDMYIIFNDNPWDFSNQNALYLCKKYNILRVQKLFLGVQVENSFGDIMYFSGEVIVDNFYQGLPKEKADTSNYLKVQLY